MAVQPSLNGQAASRAATQLDLFGEVEQAEQAAAGRELARAAWLARFERAPVPPPRLHPGDVPAPGRETRVWLGWVCPDPACGQVEPTGFTLSINHGWDPDVPGREPFGGQCQKVRRSQAQAARALENLSEKLCPSRLTPIIMAS